MFVPVGHGRCVRGSTMIINPGSHDPQGPWDPDEKKKYFDLRYFWVLMPTLLVMVGLLVFVAD